MHTRIGASHREVLAHPSNQQYLVLSQHVAAAVSQLPEWIPLLRAVYHHEPSSQAITRQNEIFP